MRFSLCLLLLRICETNSFLLEIEDRINQSQKSFSEYPRFRFGRSDRMPTCADLFSDSRSSSGVLFGSHNEIFTIDFERDLLKCCFRTVEELALSRDPKFLKPSIQQLTANVYQSASSNGIL